MNAVPRAVAGSRTAGVDEAGRGALAGPVCAAAVILDAARPPLVGLDDSKRLPPARRRSLATQIRAQALAWAVAWAQVEEVERLNVLGASLLAMRRAVEALGISPGQVLVDGPHVPQLKWPVTPVVGGDRRVAAISAASILAKVARDCYMQALSQRYPQYGFAAHKGYATRAHLQALQLYGVSRVHRRSYAPVRRVLNAAASPARRSRLLTVDSPS